MKTNGERSKVNGNIDFWMNTRNWWKPLLFILIIINPTGT